MTTIFCFGKVKVNIKKNELYQIFVKLYKINAIIIYLAIHIFTFKYSSAN